MDIATAQLPLKDHPVMRGFLFGQYANLFKVAIWWTTLGPLAYALTNDTEAIGVFRIVYNVALCLLSPLGGILIERVHPRKILLGAAGVRFLLWCVLLPLSWFLFQSSVVTICFDCLYALFIIAMFFDGAVVALSVVLDIDCAGIDSVASRYGLEVTDDDRNYFNTWQEFFFSVCFIVFAPGSAYLGLLFQHGLNKGLSDEDMQQRESGTLVAIFFFVFALATLLQFWFFRRLRPVEYVDNSELATEVGGGDTQADNVSIDHKKNSKVGPASEGGDGDLPPPTLWQQIESIPQDLKGSLQVIWSSKPILFRMIFLSLEIAFEDAAVVVIAVNMGVELPWLGDHNAVKGNIFASLGVAAGKLGGAIASFLMMKFYRKPEHPMRSITMFLFILISCVCTVIFPVINDVAHNNNITCGDGDDGNSNNTITTSAPKSSYFTCSTARGLFFFGFFLYFFFSTLPKIGLMGLFQSLVAETENGARVFGFIAIIATTFDALIVMLLSLFYTNMSLHNALWATSYAFLVHGVLELICGPLLILRPMEKMVENHEQQEQDGDKENKNDDNNKNKNTSPGDSSTEEGRSLVSVSQQTKPSRLDIHIANNIDEGYYSGGTAAVPVTQASALPVPIRKAAEAECPDENNTFVAVMSVSKGVAYGSVISKRKSALGGGSPQTATATGFGSRLNYNSRLASEVASPGGIPIPKARRDEDDNDDEDNNNNNNSNRNSQQGSSFAQEQQNLLGRQPEPQQAGSFLQPGSFVRKGSSLVPPKRVSFSPGSYRAVN